MTADFKVLPIAESTWKPLPALNNNYLILHLTNGISLHCSAHLAPDEEFILAVD